MSTADRRYLPPVNSEFFTAYERRRLIEDDLDDAEILDALRVRFEQARSMDRYRAVFTKPEPLVSVIIPTADRGDVLARRALKTLSEQTYTNLQVVVVGDQCDDDTAERVSALNDERFNFFNLPVRGPYPKPGYDRWRVAGTHPDNVGLRLVRGDLVTHIDEDDTFEPDRLSLLVKHLQRTESDIVYHPFWWENEDRSWTLMGNGTFEHGQIGTSMILYHSWLAQIPWDVYAYKQGEPGDWNRLKKFQALGVRTRNVAQPLTWHWKYPLREPFAAKPGETFLD